MKKEEHASKALVDQVSSNIDKAIDAIQRQQLAAEEGLQEEQEDAQSKETGPTTLQS